MTSQRELHQTRDRKDDPRSHSSRQLLLYSNRVVRAFKVSVHAFFRAAKLITCYRLSRLVVPGQRISNRRCRAERASAERERESADLVPVVVAKVIRLSSTCQKFVTGKCARQVRRRDGSVVCSFSHSHLRVCVAQRARLLSYYTSRVRGRLLRERRQPPRQLTHSGVFCIFFSKSNIFATKRATRTFKVAFES